MGKRAMTALWADCLRYALPSRREFLRSGLETVQHVCPAAPSAVREHCVGLATRRQFMSGLVALRSDSP